MGVPESPTPAADVIQVSDRYYILASSSLADDRTRVLKHGETFVVLDRHGDAHPVGRGQQGLYHDATRFLSRLELRLAGERPILLSSNVTQDNSQVTVDLTNPPLRLDGGRMLEQDSVHIFRSVVLGDATCHVRLRIRSYARHPVPLRLSLLLAADFADIFEVRGTRRARRGKLLAPEVSGDRLVLGYQGLDGRVRRTVVRVEPRPISLEVDAAHFDLDLAPGAEETLDLAIQCCLDESLPRLSSHEEAAEAARRALEARVQEACRVDTANEQFNDWLNRSFSDLRMMLTDTEHGPFPYAGVPWFSAPFGRDAIITALETLWVAPSIAAGVLRGLAATQAREEQPEAEAEPGKILHEARGGEMSALGEVPFRRYYGTVDATPLFVILAHAYYERTADAELLEELWPHLELALEWIDRYGDRDGDGFVEYQRRSPAGLVNQGWKDSDDSVFHDDGELARGPIALAEVQAYVYGARRGAAALAEARGDGARARQLRAQARELRTRFERHFWCPELGLYALALDGHKRPCRVRSSNAGQCLLTGIASRARAVRVAQSLLTPESFSGWGIRTLAADQPRYNPMSYHNGSVWPHDNALIAAGMARYALREPVLSILTGLFDATLFIDLHRMPELFCGFPRRPSEGPTLYPVACAPQSWAAGAVFLLLQSCLGLRISALERRLVLDNPVLPPFLESVRIRELRVGDAVVDLHLRRHPDDVGVQVLRRRGRLEIVAVK